MKRIKTYDEWLNSKADSLLTKYLEGFTTDDIPEDWLDDEYARYRMENGI